MLTSLKKQPHAAMKSCIISARVARVYDSMRSFITRCMESGKDACFYNKLLLARNSGRLSAGLLTLVVMSCIKREKVANMLEKMLLAMMSYMTLRIDANVLEKAASCVREKLHKFSEDC